MAGPGTLYGAPTVRDAGGAARQDHDHPTALRLLADPDPETAYRCLGATHSIAEIAAHLNANLALARRATLGQIALLRRLIGVSAFAHSAEA